MPRSMGLTDEQRAMARLVAAIAAVDERTAALAVVHGPERLRSARVREACTNALADIAQAHRTLAG